MRLKRPHLQSISWELFVSCDTLTPAFVAIHFQLSRPSIQAESTLLYRHALRGVICCCIWRPCISLCILIVYPLIHLLMIPTLGLTNRAGRGIFEPRDCRGRNGDVIWSRNMSARWIWLKNWKARMRSLHTPFV